ncbi:MAG: ATP-binding cassette domain-containing protein [Deltaproteobacteria bacterium]|nr:ATP-binding cassette domain-containing protein [Deltaproteobacteria bacterium]
MNPRAPYLDLRGVSYALNGTRILEAVSWKVEPGEHWAVLGPNGAGKTTLLKIVCGYLWPNAGGEVYRRGEALIDLGRLRRSIGWVTSTLADEIPPREPVLDTVVSGKYAQVGLLEYPWDPIPQIAYEQARACLKELGCEALTAKRFGALSQGEQQKVLICRARMTDPYLIILDEPCAGMDPGAREIFLASLSAIGNIRSGLSLIYVTHHVEEILPLFGKTLLLKEGRIVRSGETGEVLSAPTMQQLYGVALQLVKKKDRYWPLPE